MARCERLDAGIRHRARRDALQAECQRAFVFAVAAQVEQVAFQHQWRMRIGDGVGIAGRGDPARRSELRAPAAFVGPGRLQARIKQRLR